MYQDKDVLQGGINTNSTSDIQEAILAVNKQNEIDMDRAFHIRQEALNVALSLRDANSRGIKDLLSDADAILKWMFQDYEQSK